MKIFYWCPFLTHVATINAVKNSVSSIKKYKKNAKVKILNSTGEWDFLNNNHHNFDILDVQKLKIYKLLPKEGFLNSRLSFIIIGLLNIFPLIKTIKKERPDFLIIHLLTILPIILSPILYKNTKIILRISGLPNLKIGRGFIWKFFSKYIFAVTAPTKPTLDLLMQNNIFDKEKIFLLRDPIINYSQIFNEKKEKLEENFLNDKFYLSVGRLTNQKNFEFLINSFCKNINKFKIKKIVILGAGENEKKLKELVAKYSMENNIFLLGFKNNVYKYIFKAEAIISSSLYEDPGFFLIESAFLKKKIISSIVKNGPLEMFLIGNLCYFYESNNEYDFVNKIMLSEKDTEGKMTLKALKYAKNFTSFNHYKNLNKLISQKIQ
jgi:glycosyltransferase involved in cell wall biosynthesis